MEFEVIRNDISNMEVDAIVLPANSLLEEGSGTSKAIFERAGRRKLKKACKEILKRYHSVNEGTAVPTLGFELGAKYIIHAVTPKWMGGTNGEYGKLSSAYLSSLKIADMMDCTSIAIPLLSSGNNGFILDSALKIAIESIKSYEASNKLESVFLVIYGMHATDMCRRIGLNITEVIDQAYVLGKDERVRNTGEKILEHSADIAQKWGDYALDKAMVFLNNPSNLDLILEKGKTVAERNHLDKVIDNAIQKKLNVTEKDAKND